MRARRAASRSETSAGSTRPRKTCGARSGSPRSWATGSCPPGRGATWPAWPSCAGMPLPPRSCSRAPRMRSCAALTEMGLRRSIAIGAIAIAALAAIFVYASRGQIWQSRVIEGTFDPEFVVPASGQEDPHDVGVGFRWPERGFCLGEFRVNIAETATEVRVGQVVRHVSAAGTCAGVGTNGRSAIAHETLKSPIGSRLVVRASDGLPLPVYALDAVLDCNTAIAALGAPSDGWSAVLSQVALETGITLQANPSGESDPHAALFAKSALM